MEFLYPEKQEDWDRINYVAWFYMMLSKDYTKQVDMFAHQPEDTLEDTMKKMDSKGQRIYRGRRGQEWIHRVCEMNLIPFSRDTSHHTQTAKGDVKIIETLCDVKICKNGDLPFQGLACHEKPDKDVVQYYVFLKTDHNDNVVSPLGVITYGDYWANVDRFAQGELMPGTTLASNSDTAFLNQRGQEKYLMTFDHFLEMALRDYIPQIIETVGPSEGITAIGTGWDRYGVQSTDGTLLAGQLVHEVACELFLIREILENREGVREDLKKRAAAIYGTLKETQDPPGQVECIVYAMFDMLATLREKWFTPKGYMKFWPKSHLPAKRGRLLVP